MKKLKLYSCFMCLMAFCFAFAGCSFSLTGDNSESGYSTFAEYINDVQVVSIGNGEETGQYAFEMISTLSNIFLDELKKEYGTLAVNNISRESADTHSNAVLQDNWKYKINGANTDEQNEIQNYLQYQFTKILLGKEPLEFTTYDFANLEYVNLKANGEFAEENLKALANELSHIGFFYYELDNLAEFVLNDIIGAEIVQRDLLKFADKNNNNTFDFVENYVLAGNETTKNIIGSYSSTFEKEESKSKNGVWDRIEWKKMSTIPVIIDDIIEPGQEVSEADTIKSAQIVQEKALTLTEIEQVATNYVKSITQNTELQQTELLKFKQQNTADILTASFSGFKNYQNTIYYLLYSAMHNFTFFHLGDAEPTVIENVLTMTHKPNLTTRKIAPKNMVYDETVENPYVLPFDNYKSVMVSSNKLCGTSSFLVMIKSNMPNQDLEIDINIRYQFTSDAYREYIGPYSGESRLVQGKMMTMQIPAGEEVGYYAMLTITPENYQSLIDKGFGLEEQDITPLARIGIYNIVLNRYLPYEYGEFDKKDVFNYKEGYIANPSTTHQGSSFNYQNSMSDFLEIVFDVKGTYDIEPNFTFAINWM